MGRDMASYRVVKWFRDYADDIEAVNIHYALTALGAMPEWDRFRITHYMPLTDGQIRMKELRLPQSISSPSGEPSGRYSLHYYFEVFRGGDREYSPLYTEEIAISQTSGSPEFTGALGEVGKKVVEPGRGVEQE
jgi:hypothetical protein